MGILDKLFGSPVQAYAPDDDYWYTPRTTSSVTGLQVNPDTALTISTVFRCVSAIAQDHAAMPLILYRRNGRSKQRAPGHPLYDVLHDQPNSWQTSFQWREMMMGHLLLRGNAYNLILPGPRGFADQLLPLNPARMKVELTGGRRLRYNYTWETGQRETFTQDEIFHIAGFSVDGIVGLSLVTLARDSLGLGMAAEQYGARFFGQDATPGGVLQVKGTIGDEARERMKKSWNEAHRGVGNARRVAILEGDTTWQSVGLSNDDAQFLETRSFQIEEIARWFGVPLHRIGHTEKATSWGTGIEQFNQGYLAFTLIPWLKRWEQAIQRDLILAPRTYFVEFLMAHLLRGDTTARYNAYRVAITTGWMTRNEARELENMNPAEGLDEFLVPQNMSSIDEQGDVHPMSDGNGSQNGPDLPPVDRNNNGNALSDGPDWRAALIIHEGAARIIRKEIAAVQKAAARFAGDAGGFVDWSDGFWSEHVGYIAQALALDPETVQPYVDMYQGLTAKDLETTADQRTSELAALALGPGASTPNRQEEAGHAVAAH